MNRLLDIRPLFFLLFLFCVTAMLFAVLFLQQALSLEPCPLCITQRVFVILTGLFALLAAVHNPQGWGRRVYALLCALSAIGGGAVAGRHVWLQSLPEDLAPACGPGLGYMIENFPLREVIDLVLMGDGNCAEEVWSFLGLSIPQQTLLVFIVMAGVSVFQLVRRSSES